MDDDDDDDDDDFINNNLWERFWERYDEKREEKEEVRGGSGGGDGHPERKNLRNLIINHATLQSRLAPHTHAVAKSSIINHQFSHAYLPSSFLLLPSSSSSSCPALPCPLSRFDRFPLVQADFRRGGEGKGEVR